MSERREFDIYQTSAGYTAVTNPVRRSILEALEKGELELGDLVKVTGKSKPTLSNLHMRELLEQHLIEEKQHPTDARRKTYRVIANRIGSSNVPLEQLRGAVKHYVSLSPLAYAIPFPVVLDVLCADGNVDPKTMRRQANVLGEKASSLFVAATPRDVLTALGGFWEREKVARTVRIDFDKQEIELELLESMKGKSPDALATIFAGIIEGVLQARLGRSTQVTAKASKGGRLLLALGATRK